MRREQKNRTFEKRILYYNIGQYPSLLVCFCYQREQKECAKSILLENLGAEGSVESENADRVQTLVLGCSGTKRGSAEGDGGGWC